MASTTAPITTTPPTDAELIELARDAATRAYAPYSHFPVGAALYLDDGRIVTGCNVENASYPLGTCAERNAAFHMIASANDSAPGPGTGEPHRPTILAAAVVGLKNSPNPTFPCGACRQVLNEFGCQRVIVEGPTGPASHDFDTILPHSFGPDDL